MQNYNKKSDFARIIAKKSVPLHSKIRISEIMTQEQEEQLMRLLKSIDISDVLKVASNHGNRYNRRILKFFRWFCKWAPVFIMCVHTYGMLEFAHHPREMIIPIRGNTACYMFIYLMVYIMPMIIILASRFFFLCWKYRIPFLYYFGVNAIHIVHGSVFTTNSMIMSHYALFVMIAVIYAYAFSDILLNTYIGRKIFK